MCKLNLSVAHKILFFLNIYFEELKIFLWTFISNNYMLNSFLYQNLNGFDEFNELGILNHDFFDSSINE